jgi:Transposase DDE domain
MISKKHFQDCIMMLVVKHTGMENSMAEKFACMTTGLIDFGSVKITRLAQCLSGVLSSCTRSLERFYVNCFINTVDMGSMVYEILSLKGRGPFTIIIDRTNWDFGTKHINIFVGSILFRNTVIPLLFDVSNKAGSSNFKERKQLIDQLIFLLGRENIKVIIGDREFIGEEWFTYLYENKLPFIFRLRNNMYVITANGKVRVDKLLEGIEKHEIKQMTVIVSGVTMLLAATRAETGELVVVVASRVHGNILKRYKARWFIELFFKSTKSMGFNFEETHITDSDRIKVLMATITIATCIAVQSGFFKHRIRPIRRKKHGRSAFSIFTYGLRFVRRLFQDGSKVFAQELGHYLEVKKIPIPILAQVFFSFVLGHNFVGY